MEAPTMLLKRPGDNHRGGNEAARKFDGGGGGEQSPISCTPSSPMGISKENFTPDCAVMMFPNKDASSCPWLLLPT